MMREHPEAYSTKANVRLTLTPLRDQIASPARTILLVLLAAAGVVFIIACSNVANLILARSVRREGELLVRAALGASQGALRRTLLAESLVLCAAGALVGITLARPFVHLVSQFAARFSIRALEVTVDATLLWVGAGLALAAAVLLAYLPRLPHSRRGAGDGGGMNTLRITPGTNRRLRVFATLQIAFSFVLLAGAGTLLAALVVLQTTPTGLDMRQVLALDVPPAATGTEGDESTRILNDATRRIAELPGVTGVAAGIVVPWRDSGNQLRLQFGVDGYTPENGEEHPHARLRIVSPGFFSVLGVALVAGRDFTEEDRDGSEPVVIVSQSIARRLFPDGDILNRKLMRRAPVLGVPVPRRIVGVVADVDDENVVRGPAQTVYYPVRQMGFASRLFVQAEGNPYALEPAVRKIIRDIAPNQPVEQAATLEDVRAEKLAPERLNAFVITGFAGIALLIAVVGVAGVLAFSVSARTREFGVRLAIGSTPRHLLVRVLLEGAVIVVVGIAAGAVGGYAFVMLAGSYFGNLHLPGALPIAGAAIVLTAAAVAASLLPAAKASRVDVLQALRSE
jgi:predicted permease